MPEPGPEKSGWLLVLQVARPLPKLVAGWCPPLHLAQGVGALKSVELTAGKENQYLAPGGPKARTFSTNSSPGPTRSSSITNLQTETKLKGPIVSRKSCDPEAKPDNSNGKGKSNTRRSIKKNDDGKKMKV